MRVCCASDDASRNLMIIAFFLFFFVFLSTDLLMILDKFTDNNVIVRLIALNQFTYHHNRDSEKKIKIK